MTSFTVHCTHCDTAFPVDPEKVPAGGVRARCTSCEGIFFVAEPLGTAAEVAPAKPEVAPAKPEVAPAGPAPPPEPDVAPSRPEVEPVETESAEEPILPEETSVEVGGDAREAAEELAEDLEDPDLITEAVPHAEDDAGFGSFDDEIELVDSTPSAAAVPDLEEEVADPMPEVVGDVAEEIAPDVGAPTEIESDVAAETDLEIETDFEVESDVEVETDLEIESGPDVEPEASVETGSKDAGVDLAEAVEVAESAPDLAEEVPTVPAGFQFGKRDPHEKARRLARVLVSDMITYNPDRHARALERDTLAEDFEEEIEKSWEEYVDQVGAEMAESTPYWTNALNEVLVKGRKVF